MNRLLTIAILLTATFLMGSSFVVGKLGLIYFSPLMLTAIRFLLGGGLLLTIVLAATRTLPSAGLLWKSAVIGALQTAGVMAAIFISLQYITAGQSSILTFTNPLLVLILSSLIYRERHPWSQWIGILCGLLGVVIVLGGETDVNQGTWIGLSAALFWAIATLLVNRFRGDASMWLLTALQMTFGGLLLLLLALLTEPIRMQWQSESLLIVLWLAIPGSIVQFGLWYILLSRMSPSTASSYLFLAPVFGVLTGAIWLHEPLGVQTIIGGSLVFAGIFLAQRQPRPKS